MLADEGELFSAEVIDALVAVPVVEVDALPGRLLAWFVLLPVLRNHFPSRQPRPTIVRLARSDPEHARCTFITFIISQSV